MLDGMHLAGIPVRRSATFSRCRSCPVTPGSTSTAEKLENGYDRETKVLALTITDREVILRALDDPPDSARSSFAGCSFASTSGGFARGSCSRRSWGRRRRLDTNNPTPDEAVPKRAKHVRSYLLSP